MFTLLPHAVEARSTPTCSDRKADGHRPSPRRLTFTHPDGSRAVPELMQADLVDAPKAELAEKGMARLEKDTRLVERDEQIAALRRRVRALADVE
jgi:hypothetical protein